MQGEGERATEARRPIRRLNVREHRRCLNRRATTSKFLPRAERELGLALQKFVKRNPKRRRRLPFLAVLLNDSRDLHLKDIYDVTYRGTDSGCRGRECPLFRLFQDLRRHAEL